MKTTVEVKIKIDDKTEITLNSEDAKELYFKLKEIFEEKVNYYPYPFYPLKPYYYGDIIYTSSSGKFEITNGASNL